tara:strand:+ start:902 stop:2578 length:1677 start_codon:yes stop_codon:yes gene_type:complete
MANSLNKVDDRGLNTPIDLLDNEKIQFGTGNDLQIWHDGTSSKIHNDTGSLLIEIDGTNLQINKGVSENLAKFIPDGTVELYYDSSKKFETVTNGVLVSGSLGINGQNTTHAANTLKIGHEGSGVHQLRAYGPDGSTNGQIHFRSSRSDGSNSKDIVISAAGNLEFPDNQKATFGTGDDLAIYHNNGTSYIDATGAGNTNAFSFNTAANLDIRVNSNEQAIYATANGSVGLYYNSVKSFETTTNGAIVYGGEGEGANLYLYADEGDDDSDKWRFATVDNGNVYLQNYADGAWETNTLWNHGAGVELYYDNVKKLETTSSGLYINGAAVFPDGSSKGIQIGSSSDLQLYHDGSHSYIKDNGTGQLRIQSDNLSIENAAGNENVAFFAQDGAVTLYHNHAAKVATSATGATVTGVVDADAFTGTADTAFKYVVSTQGDTNIPHNTYTTIQSDYGWVLPAAGTYLLSSSMRVRQWAVTGLIQCRLYDTTNSSVITSPDSTRMMWEDQNGDTRNVQITLTWIHTCSGAVTINQQFNTSNNSNNTSIQNDANGRNYAYWQRIG